MERKFIQNFLNISSIEYTNNRLRNAEFEKEIHLIDNGALLEWFDSKVSLTVRYRMKVLWSEPVKKILGEGQIIIIEKRIFNNEKNKILINSTIKTSFPYLSASIIRNIEDNKDGCLETLILKIEYLGNSFKDQISIDFFKSIAKHIFPLNSNEKLFIPIEPKPNGGLFVPQKYTTNYLTIHSELKNLQFISNEFLNKINETKLNRNLILLPNLEKFNNILDFNKFSIQNNINELKIESENTKKLVNQLKKTRQKSSSISSLPLFALVTCTAIFFVIISK